MLSPLQSAFFIESKTVSIVSSACFCVSCRLATRMAMRSLFSMCFLDSAEGCCAKNQRLLGTLPDPLGDEQAPSRPFSRRQWPTSDRVRGDADLATPSGPAG